MKNKIIIDVDTSREQHILICKNDDFPQPTTRDGAEKMLLEDIACVTEALITLVNVMDQNNYLAKETLINKITTQLNEFLLK